MKFLKFRYIFTLAIVLVVGITLMVYFLGGLSATALEDLNLEFTYEGYVDFSEYDEDGYKWLVFDTEAEMNEGIKDIDPSLYQVMTTDAPYIVRVSLERNKIVAQNELYTMFLDEATTIVTVGVNKSYNKPVPTEKTKDGFIKYELNSFDVKYQTALPTENANDAKSNAVVRYVGANGKVNSLSLTTFANSVQYRDLITGENQRHYKIKFDIENGIEILYEIGEFTVFDTFFPAYFAREDLFEYFLGNLMFIVNTSDLNSKNIVRYDSAITWSAECAAYLEANDLATVTPQYTLNPDLDEDGNPIPARYSITDILEKDENGNNTNVLKLKIGRDYNASDINAEGASPCIANPFFVSYMYNVLFEDIYSLQAAIVDENGNVIERYHTNWREWVNTLSPTFVHTATGTTQHSQAYDFMYKKHSERESNYLYVKAREERVTAANYEEMSHLYPGVNIGDKIVEKTKISYFEDLSTVVYGYFNFNENKFYSDKAMNNEVAGEEGMNYVDLDKGLTYMWDGSRFEETDHGYVIGGFQARDEDGNFLYDENGNPIQDVLTLDQSNIQNEKYNIQSEVAPPIFQFALRFELTDKGLKTTLLENSIIEGKGRSYTENGSRTKFSHDSKLFKIDVIPFMTSNGSSDSEGQIILPDGSGAIISFNSPKISLGYNAFAKRIYGPDKAFVFDESQETEANKRLMFGMFGFLDKTNKKGVLAIVDRGASQTEIYANFKRAIATSKNIAYFTAHIRENEIVYVGSARTEFNKWANDRSNTDFSYIYQFMSEEEFIDDSGNIEYVTLANKYRDYLIQKYNLQEKDTTSSNVLALNFLGAFEKREVTLGFRHNVEYSLTTFEQAQAIIEELQSEGGEEFAVSYTAWTKHAMEPRATNKVKVSKVLGDAKGILSFQQFLDEQNINFYPEVRITSNKGYDYSFGNMKYTSKTIGGALSQHREYDLATRRASDTITPVAMLSPRYYVEYISRYLPSYQKLGLNSAFVSDIGNVKAGDYARSRITYPEQGMQYQISALDKVSENLDSLMLSAPYDYAIKYVDLAVNVPLESTLLGYYDYSIPFYQLVVSGLFDYAGPAINYDSERSPNWYLLKALETGSNLYFLISAEDTKVLLDTDYTMFYNTYYPNWKNEIIRLNSIINSVGIHESRLVSHKILADNIYEVGYDNGLKLIINFTNSPYYDYNSGLSVRANWFVVTEEANS